MTVGTKILFLLYKYGTYWLSDIKNKFGGQGWTSTEWKPDNEKIRIFAPKARFLRKAKMGAYRRIKTAWKYLRGRVQTVLEDVKFEPYLIWG